MKVYIVVYYHRHGSDTWPRFTADNAPAPDAVAEIDQLEDFEPDRDESVEIFGPFDVPTPEQL